MSAANSNSEFSKIKPIVCSFCGTGNRDTYLSYFKWEKSYYVSNCCGVLLCYNCRGSRGKCIACSNSNTSVVEKRKHNWISRFETYDEWNELCTTYRFMLPFTGTGKFGTWRDVLDIIDIGCRMHEHPRYRELFRCYNKFVDDFYSSQMLFYTLSSAPVGKLYFIDLKPSPAMKQFFSNVADMAKFSRFSRKTVLSRYPFGFIILLFKKMIGYKTGIQANILRNVLKYCLAKKASQKLPF